MKLLNIFILLFFAILLFAYDSGELPFSFLNVPASPLSSSLSYTCAAYTGNNNDIYNPASIYANENNEVYFSYTNYLANTHLGYIEYNMDAYRFNIKYFNSGFMEKRDTLNNYLGDFSANILLFNGGSYYEINEDIILGYSVLLGIENADDYSQYAAGVSVGAIYKAYKNLNMGFYSSNIGASYNQDSDISILPTRIITGLSYDMKNMKIMADAGKVLDSDYFLSMGVELFLIGNNSDYINNETVLNENNLQTSVENENAEIENDSIIMDSTNNINVSEDSIKIDSINMEIKKDISIVDSNSIDNVNIQQDSINIDSIIIDSIQNETAIKDSTETNNKEETYMSYADYLEQMEKENQTDIDTLNNETNADSLEINNNVIEENKNTFENTETVIQENVKKQSDINFVLRFGVSTDKKELEMGTSSDIIAGLSSGFGLSYKQYRIDYSAKFLGELGISHSIGIKVSY